MREIEPEASALHQRNEDEVESVLRRNGGDIAKALFAKGGAYENAARHGSRPPYQLPESWLKY